MGKGRERYVSSSEWSRGSTSRRGTSQGQFGRKDSYVAGHCCQSPDIHRREAMLDGLGGLKGRTHQAGGGNDGKHLLFTEQKGQSYVLHSLSIDSKTSAPFGNVKSAEPPGATFSPDGRWIAYASSERAGGGVSQDRGIFVQPFP